MSPTIGQESHCYEKIRQAEESAILELCPHNIS